MNKTVRLFDREIEWLSTFDDNFHDALIKVKSGCIAHKDLKIAHDEIISKLEDIESQIEQLKRY